MAQDAWHDGLHMTRQTKTLISLPITQRLELPPLSGPLFLWHRGAYSLAHLYPAALTALRQARVLTCQTGSPL